MTTIITRNVGHDPNKELFNIRPARLDDKTAISIVELKAVKDENRITPFGMTLNQLTQVWKRRITNKEFEIFVACDVNNSDRIYGFISIDAPSNREALIQAIYIDPMFYRRGIGASLISYSEKLFALRACPRVILYVEPFNRVGHSFYKKLGFQLTNKKFHHLNILVKEYSSC